MAFKKDLIFIFILVLISIPFALSVDFTPQGNLELRDVYHIDGAVNINSSTINATNTLYSNVTRYGSACIYQNSTGSLRLESTCTV